MRFSARRRKERRAFTLIELLIVIAVIAIIAALVVPKFLKGRRTPELTALYNDVKSIIAAETQWYDDQGRYAYAVRCFVDPNWASFSDVCGDPNRFKTKYIDIGVANWEECELDPTASATDRNGCISSYDYKIELTNTAGTHGTLVIQDMTEEDALVIAGLASRKGANAFEGQSYADVDVAKNETDGIPKGFWIVQDPNTGLYDVYFDY